MDNLKNLDELNSRVTDAIIEGERLLDETIKEWEHIAHCEGDIAIQSTGIERDIAQRGLASAEKTVAILKVLRDPSLTYPKESS